MSKRSFGSVLVAVGLVVAAIAALADQIGLGGVDSFGWKQITGVVVGVVISDVGFLVAWRGRRREENAGSGK